MLFLIAITLAAIVKVLAIVLLFNRFKKKRSNVKPSTFKIRTYRNEDMNYNLANNPETISQRTNSIGVWCTIGTFRCNENCIENLTGAILTCRCAGVSGKELVFWTAKLHTIFNSTIIKIAHCDATHERNSTNANIRAISFFTIVFVNIELVDLGKHILFYIRVYVINNVVAKQRQSTATLDNHKQSLLWIKYCVNNFQMDFTYCEFPSTVSIDTFKAYFDASNVRLPKIENLLSEVPTEDQAKQVKTLRHLVLDAIVSNWSGKKRKGERRRESTELLSAHCSQSCHSTVSCVDGRTETTYSVSWIRSCHCSCSAHRYAMTTSGDVATSCAGAWSRHSRRHTLGAGGSSVAGLTFTWSDMCRSLLKICRPVTTSRRAMCRPPWTSVRRI